MARSSLLRCSASPASSSAASSKAQPLQGVTGAAVGGSARGLGWLARRIQSGNIRSYAGWLALGAAAFLIITLFSLHGLRH